MSVSVSVTVTVFYACLFSCKDIPRNDTTYWTATRKAACDDPPNGFGTRWRNYNVRVDPSDGKIVWQRVDSYMSNEGVTENGVRRVLCPLVPFVSLAQLTAWSDVVRGLLWCVSVHAARGGGEHE